MRCVVHGALTHWAHARQNLSQSLPAAPAPSSYPAASVRNHNSQPALARPQSRTSTSGLGDYGLFGPGCRHLENHICVAHLSKAPIYMPPKYSFARCRHSVDLRCRSKPMAHWPFCQPWHPFAEYAQLQIPRVPSLARLKSRKGSRIGHDTKQGSLKALIGVETSPAFLHSLLSPDDSYTYQTPKAQQKKHGWKV